MENLEERLKTILNSFSKRLSEDELNENYYSSLLFYSLRSEGLLSGNKEDNSYSLGTYMALFQEKLKYKTLEGLDTDYIAFDKIHISTEAQEDIKRYNELKEGAREYIRIRYKYKIGIEQISNDEFEGTLRTYLNQKAPGLSSYRRGYILGRFIAEFEHEFGDRIKKEEETMLGNYSLKTIRDTLENL